MEKNPKFGTTDNSENMVSAENPGEELAENELDEVTGGTNPTPAPKPATQPTESTSFTFSKIEIEYKPQK